MELSATATANARSIFLGEDPSHPACIDCGGVHMRACPRVKSMHTEVDPNSGAVIRRTVEYWPAGTWEKGVIFFDDLDV